MDTINKLQFKHHSEIITGATLPEAREAVLQYITDQWYNTTAYNDPNSDYRSLYAEPTVFRYAAEGDEANPHIILMIGADTNDGSRQEYNKFCIIDIDKTEQEIADLAEELEKAIKSLTVVALDTNTLDLHAEKTEEGTFVSGDVKTATHHVFDDITKYNNLMIASGGTEGPEGLFIYVDLTYDEATESFTFVVTNADGTLKKQEVKLPNNYLVSGRYSVQDQSIHLKMKNGDDVVVDCTYLIAEWDTEKELSKTPIVLVREPVGYGEDAEYYHLEPWQDVLKADVRLKDEVKDEETGKYIKDPNSTNILDRTLDGKYLYVDGKASNIIYYWNGEKSNVKEQLDKLNQVGISQDNDNILWDRADGFFASVKLDYISNQNKLIFTTTNVSANGHTIVKEIPLNTVEVFKYIYYDATTEELVMVYTNDKGEEKVVRIPIGQMINEWDVLNEAHSVYLKKQRNVSGKDLLSGDVNISDGENNILVDRNHALYVRGEADNIKYDKDSGLTVKNVLDSLKAEDEAINQKLDGEIDRAQAAEQELTDKIGTGFTSDPHENVTYKFEQLENKVNEDSDKLDAEIERSIAKDAEHDEKLAEQQAEIEAISADSANSLKDIINNDHSIDIDKTDAVRPIISLNISSEDDNTIRLVQEDGKYGIYNYVDLSYDPSGNTLTFTRSDKNSIDKVIKTIQLDTISFIEDIYYDPDHDELVIIYYSGHERKEVRVPLRGLIDEWTTSDNTDGAIKLTKIPAPTPNDKDILYGEVLISDIHGNILENENGKLFVSNSGITANTAAIDGLTTRLESEIERSIAKDDEHDAAINTINNRLVVIDDDIADLNRDLTNEINRSTAKDTELETAIADERARAEAADRELYQKIADETVARASGDTMLQSQLDQEISRATMKEGEIERNLQSEIERSTAEDQRLADAITAETEARREGDAELEQMVLDATLTFANTTTAKMNKSDNNVVTTDVIVPVDDNIIIVDEGIKALVKLNYNAASNTLVLEKTSASGHTYDTVQLNAGSIIESITYDNETKELVIRYESTSEPGVQHETRVGVSDLFNPWIVNNLSEKSAVRLEKAFRTGPLAEDELSGRVLITDDRDGDGKPDSGSDNIIEIRNNGLYVCGSAMTDAHDIAVCVQNEIKVLEKAVIGHIIGEECGSGYTYEPNTMATYINSANSFNNADYILDQSIKNIENKVDEVSAKTDCIDSEAKKMYELLYGEGTSMPECGEGVHYHPYTGACIISAATSFNEADQMLNDQICELLEMWVSGMTCTTESNWIDEGANKKMQVDVRPSYGNDAEMTDDDLYIHDQIGGYIEPGVTEFTDTNALRIVCLTEGGSIIPDIKSKQNGLYLSNVWDCGMYYGPDDTEAKAAAEAAGYNTDYSTDEDASASNYDYMNNVRQSDVPHP